MPYTYRILKSAEVPSDELRIANLIMQQACSDLSIPIPKLRFITALSPQSLTHSTDTIALDGPVDGFARGNAIHIKIGLSLTELMLTIPHEFAM